MTSGLIFSQHRLSTDDGPGLRDTFFLKGCRLRCAWCHNPESFATGPEVWWLARKCIGSLDCVRACPHHALAAGPAGILIDRAACDGCALCVEACAAEAMEPIGKRWTADELVAEALKDRPFFQNSGGGVTLSGGEPTLQPGFVAEVFRLLQAAGIHTALDTCGMNLGPHMEAILAHTDLVLYDLKEIDPALHRQWTGVSNNTILDTFLATLAHTRPDGSRPEIWVRTPLIPGYTATRRNLQGIGTFLAENAGNRIVRWELCAFNPACTEKYGRLGMDWALANRGFMERDPAEDLLQAARLSSGLGERVRLTGMI